jgi:hypothetical protein
VVYLAMTSIAQCDQVSLGVVPAMTAQFLVMDFKVALLATQLTLPSISTEHLLPQLAVLARC